jgi:hypothetical protein
MIISSVPHNLEEAIQKAITKNIYYNTKLNSITVVFDR